MDNLKKHKKIVDGIPFFSEDRYWGKAPKEQLEKAISVLEEKGWKEFKSQYRNTFDSTFDENRADWRFVIPLPNNFSVLDAGAGMGRISIPLARVAKKVTSIDQSFLRMKFLKMRAEAEGLKNIEVQVSDIFDASFEPESFDLIVMNGLLEWVGATERFTNPREAQIESLRIAKKLLRKDGFLYIGIENRFALSYFHATDHSGLRYTSYMPRFLADLYMRVRKGKRYDTYTYTRNGYKKLLKEAGFNNVEFYLPYPGYNLPRIMIPHQNLRALSYAISSLLPTSGKRKRVAWLLVRSKILLHLYRHVFFSFGIVAQK